MKNKNPMDIDTLALIDRIKNESAFREFAIRAISSHDEMLNLLKGFVENLDLKSRHDMAQFSALVYKAIAKADGVNDLHKAGAI
jgi:tellurite resistance protein